MERAAIRLTIELDVAGDTLTGRVSDESGTTVDVVGRIGLLAAIDALAGPERGDVVQRLRPVSP